MFPLIALVRQPWSETQRFDFDNWGDFFEVVVQLQRKLIYAAAAGRGSASNTIKLR